MTVKVGDTITVRFTATVERVGDDGLGNRHVYANKFWLAPEYYEVVTSPHPLDRLYYVTSDVRNAVRELYKSGLSRYQIAEELERKYRLPHNPNMVHGTIRVLGL